MFEERGERTEDLLWWNVQAKLAHNKRCTPFKHPLRGAKKREHIGHEAFKVGRVR